MNGAGLLLDAFGRVEETVREVLDGLTAEQLAWRPSEQANSIGWLVWHLLRIQDDHVADVAGVGQVWLAGGWVERFALPLPSKDHGYGHSPEQAASVRPSAELLTGYLAGVHLQTIGYVEGLADTDLDRIVDTRWDPPVTLAVRLVSVISDDLQHAGQAAYLRGLL